jgi:hypothetical protein
LTPAAGGDTLLVEMGWVDHEPVSRDLSPSVKRRFLYISFRTGDGAWGRPIDLSQRLSLPEGEMLPTLSPDQDYLFFCNRGDIYWVSARIIEGLRLK